MVLHDARDWDAMRSMLTDDFVFVDHRPTSFGAGESAADYIQLLRVAVDLVPDRRIASIEPVLDAPDAVFRMEAAGTDEFGGSIDWDFLAVWDMRDNCLSRLEVFPVDDLAGAVRCVEGLRAG